MNTKLRNQADHINPLLMNFTPMSKIEESEESQFSYNEITQTTMYDMRSVGTRCLKTFSTQKTKASQKVDRKNEIDDQKSA